MPAGIKPGIGMMVSISSIQMVGILFESGVTCKLTVEAGQCSKEGKTKV